MKSFIYAVMFFGSLSASDAALVNIKTTSVDKYIGEDVEAHTFVKFYAPWCGHCKKMRPEWEKLAEIAPLTHKNIVVADVDCTTDKEVCDRFSVGGFPTIKYFEPHSESGEDYGENDRTAASFQKWVDKHLSSYKCNMKEQENCSEEQVAFLETLKRKSLEDMSLLMEKNSKDLQDAKNVHEELLKELQAKFTSSSTDVKDLNERVNMENALIRRVKQSEDKDEL